jgi:hypothetical protein
MSLTDELEKLQKLHQSGALSSQEFAAAKAKLIGAEGQLPLPTTDVERQLHAITHQNEVAELDREWEISRESYMVTGKFGHRYIPSQAGSAFAGVLVALFGTLWTVFAFGMTRIVASTPTPLGGMIGLFPLFGILFVVAGVGMSIYSFVKASEYANAERQYRRRRAELLSRRQDQRTNDADGSEWG